MSPSCRVYGSVGRLRLESETGQIMVLLNYQMQGHEMRKWYDQSHLRFADEGQEILYAGEKRARPPEDPPGAVVE